MAITERLFNLRELFVEMPEYKSVLLSGLDGWERQGTEYAAETIAWAVFDEGLRLIGEVDDDVERLRAGFQLLTANSAPTERHDHSVVRRAISLEERLRTGARYRPDRSGPAARPDLTLEQFNVAWEQVVRDRGLPIGLGSWTEERGGTVVATEITPVVGLIASLNENGLIGGLTLTGRGESLYDTYDTVLAWSVLSAILFPEEDGETWGGSFDSPLSLSGSEVRGYVRLGTELVDGSIVLVPDSPHRDGSGRLP